MNTVVIPACKGGKMAQQDLLQHTVATFLGVEPQHIQPALSFTGTRLHGSLARARLYTALQQSLGIQCPAVFTARTYGELHTAVFGTPAVASEITPPQPRHSAVGDTGLSEQTSLAGGLACGIDIEMVDNLPRVQDYWEDPFYTATFTASETAYCLLQANPPLHFAARWCAKEALKKCDPAYSHTAMNQLEVTLTTTGAPVLQTAMHGTWERLPVTVSLSHTTSMAAAVVIKSPAVNSTNHSKTAPVALPSSTVPVRPAPASSAISRSRLGTHLLPTLLGLGALGVALWAWVRTW
jgi:phosphopantetheine--protein transferase-like protein